MIHPDRFAALFLRVSTFAAVAVFVAGCGHPKNTNSVNSPLAPSQALPTATVQTDESSSKTPVKNSLVALLEQDARTDHVFPAGVQVKSVTLRDGVASIDFSHEFNDLANSGETVESEAQHALRKALSKFATIEKMRVTVDGKPFDSQATDWNTPFSVHDTVDTAHKNPPTGSDSASR